MHFFQYHQAPGRLTYALTSTFTMRDEFIYHDHGEPTEIPVGYVNLTDVLKSS